MPDLEQFLAAYHNLAGGGLYQTFDRRLAGGTRTTATGVMELASIFLPAGLSVTNINLWTVGVVTTNTHNWAALYRADLSLIAQSTDDTTSGDHAANAKITKALTAGPFVTPYTGLYYVAWMQTSSGQNTMLCSPAIVASSVVLNDAPIQCGTSTGSLTTTAPAIAAAVTNAGTLQQLYATVS